MLSNSFIIIVLQSLVKGIAIILPLLIAIAYFTLAERKVIGSIQRRRGPNVVGAFGLLQPLADGLKLLLKETILPSSANTVVFVLAPVLTFTLSLVGWVVIPFGEGMVFSDLPLGILFLFAVSSLGVYGVIMSGWASNSKYAFLGGLRSAAQMVSYEVSIGFILIGVLLCAGSMNVTEIVRAQEAVWFAIPLLPFFGMFFISALAETNRHPFDLPEAEAELVAGYNVEYSAMGFALFFLGEYGSMLLMCSMTAILFLGGWLPPVSWLSWVSGPIWLALKVTFFAFVFIWVRAALPRYRYDQLMRLGWKIFLPLTLGLIFLYGGILMSFDWLPA